MAGKGEGPAIEIDLGTKYSCGMEMAEMEMEMEERSFVVSSDPHQKKSDKCLSSVELYFWWNDVKEEWYSPEMSDVLGQFMPFVGMDWSQTGVTNLFSAIKLEEFHPFVPETSLKLGNAPLCDVDQICACFDLEPLERTILIILSG
uniref:Uncharacterized protein n=1 Tax=Cucumis melo TaxID=3656 RepID=A0A9I9EKA5_CUCME